MKALILISSGLLLLSLSYKEKEAPYQGFDLKNLEKSLKYIPSGYMQMGRSDSDSPFLYSDDNIHHYFFIHDRYNPEIDSFFICEKEVTNGEYLEFLTTIKAKDTVLYNEMLPDTTVWRTNSRFGEPFIEYYLRHPAYSKHPVVGVTHAQAMAYCDWLTQKYSEFSKRKYKTVRFKLPTMQQWVYAARGGSLLNIFPWEGSGMQDEKGNWLANFKIIDQKTVGVLNLGAKYPNGNIKFNDYFVGFPEESKSKDGIDMTLKVKSLSPNNYGLYQMAGNVSEYVEEFGITKGGSWNTTGYYLLNDIHQHYDSTNLVSSDRGFRFVMEIIEY